MANEASVTVQATVLPDEISQIISGSISVSLAATNAGDKWYYQKTTVKSAGSDELIIKGKTFVEADALAFDATPTVITDSETVKFLLVKNLDTSNYVSISLNGAASKAASEIKVAAGEMIAFTPNSTTVANLEAIADTANVNCVVAAIINDAA